MSVTLSFSFFFKGKRSTTSCSAVLTTQNCSVGRMDLEICSQLDQGSVLSVLHYRTSRIYPLWRFLWVPFSKSPVLCWVRLGAQHVFPGGSMEQMAQRGITAPDIVAKIQIFFSPCQSWRVAYTFKEYVRKSRRESQFSVSFKEGRVIRWRKMGELKTYHPADFYSVDIMNH